MAYVTIAVPHAHIRRKLIAKQTLGVTLMVVFVAAFTRLLPVKTRSILAGPMLTAQQHCFALSM
jgi:hypothetical protein